MLVTPISNPGLGNTSYLVDLGDGSALVVDPERDPRPYLDAAKDQSLAIRHVLETHIHADFVSGSWELMALGATLIAPRMSQLAHPAHEVEDGDEITVGDLLLQVMATPGHTPEHVAYVLSDGTAPKVVFTGGTLMAGGVARPDLISSDLTVPLAHDAYRSVRRLFDTLPADVEVRPTHGGGSFCSAGADTSGAVSTVGSERLTHPVALAPSEQDFVDDLLAGLGTYPTYFGRLRAVNQAGPRTFGEDLPRLVSLDAAALTGTTIIDVRPIDRFAAGHIPGSISNDLRDQFGTWLGWLFEPTTPLAFVLDVDQEERNLVSQALNVGHEAFAGKVSIGEWTTAGGELDTIDIVTPDHMGPGMDIVDVRQDAEWLNGHVPGAIHIELGSISTSTTTISPGAVVHCGHGQRAMTAASLLARRGAVDIAVTRAGPAEITAALDG